MGNVRIEGVMGRKEEERGGLSMARTWSRVACCENLSETT